MAEPGRSAIHHAVLSDAQARVLALVQAALAERLAAMGPDASGLYGYYVRKLDHDALLSQCDARAIELLRARRGRFQRVWEIGPGIGQLSVMLALDGHQLVLVERDQRRAGALLAMLDVLRQVDETAWRRVSVIQGSFPEALPPAEVHDRDMALALGCTFTATAGECLAFERALARFGLALIDFGRLFTEATDRADWCDRAARFAAIYAVEAAPMGSFVIPEEGKAGELFLTRAPSDGTSERT